MPLRLAKCIARQSLDGRPLAAKLQYPDMDSAVEADLQQLQLIFAIHKRMDPVIDTSEIAEEIGARLREELDYEREAKHMRSIEIFSTAYRVSMFPA